MGGEEGREEEEGEGGGKEGEGGWKREGGGCATHIRQLRDGVVIQPQLCQVLHLSQLLRLQTETTDTHVSSVQSPAHTL